MNVRFGCLVFSSPGPYVTSFLNAISLSADRQEFRPKEG